MMDFFLDLRDDILDFIDNHRKGLIIISFIAIIILIAIMVMMIMLSPVKITITNADTELGEVVGTKASTLYFYATSKKNGEVVDTKGFKWEVSGGIVEVNEDGVATWTLPSDEGTYSITASNEDTVGTKYVTVIGSELSSLYKNSDYKILLQDTDGDGLTDLYESSYSKTSTNERDTDSDGLFDGDEIIMNLDPKVKDSKSDGLNDGERKLEYTFKTSDVTLSMTGKGNFTRTSVDKYSTETLENVSSVLDGLYSLYTEAELDDAKVTIKYSKDKIAEKKLTENSLAVYKLDDQANTFTKVASELDTNASTLVFTTSELGKYFVADSSKLTSNLATELVFVIDNSGSMYSKDEYASSEENDPEFKRVDVVNELVDKLQGNYKFGAGKFTYEYTELSKLTSDRDTIKNRVSTIKTVSESFTGTYIGKGIEGGLNIFTSGEENNRRYMILLSDGVDSKNEGYDEKLLEAVINTAKEKRVKIYTIGLGSSIDEKALSNIAAQTNGKYYFAPTADDLEETFNTIAAELCYNLYDTTNDGVYDAIVLADSGFGVKRDGFSFSNFSNTQVEHGYGYGMVLFSKLFYEGKVPDSLGAKKITTLDGNVVIAPAVEPGQLDIEGKSLRTYKPKSLSVLCDLPDNFWSPTISSGTLVINSNAKQELNTLGFETYTVPYKADHAGFNKYESIRFNMDQYIKTYSQDEQEPESPLEDDDVQLLKTLSRFDITKYRDDKFYFYDNNDTAFERLTSTLNSGSPVMIRINDDYTVLAIKVLADSNNMNKFKIEVYDPNYAGVKKYIEVDRYKYSEIAEISKVVTDKFEYKFKYQGTDVGICLSFPNIQENE